MRLPIQILRQEIAKQPTVRLLQGSVKKIDEVLGWAEVQVQGSFSWLAHVRVMRAAAKELKVGDDCLVVFVGTKGFLLGSFPPGFLSSTAR